MKQYIPNSNAMKRIFSVFTIAAVMVACNPSPNTTTVAPASTSATNDTTGFNQFQAWKAQNELANPNAYNNNTNAQSVATLPNRSNAVSYTPAHSTARRSVSHTSHRSYSRSRSYGNGGSYSSSSAGTARARRGWSKSAKGAVIGGVAGGVAGAIINKRNRVAGGVIGGVLGAGVGYGIGRGMDRRDGRY